MKVGVATLVVVCAVVVAGCSTGDQARVGSASASGADKRLQCPSAWRASWQRLANRIGAPVYCPTWMPDPLDAHVNGGNWNDGLSVTRARSYLASFLYHDQSGDVHVNFRGYPGRTTIPRCIAVNTVAGVTHRTKIPCFADPHGRLHANGIDATFYTVNQDVDQWHVLYAWRHDGSLYAVSQHVTRPLTYRKVAQSLARLVRGLVLVRPAS